MFLVKRTLGTRWLALLALVFVLVVSGVTSSHAQQVIDPSKNSGLLEGEDGVDQGDPDMPTGDLPPPSGSGSTGTETGTYRGHGTTGGITEAVPTRRWGLWAHWKVAMKLFARHSFLLR